MRRDQAFWTLVERAIRRGIHPTEIMHNYGLTRRELCSYVCVLAGVDPPKYRPSARRGRA